MSRLHRSDTEKKSLWQRVVDLALTDVGVLVRGIDQDTLERVEELLLAADFGAPATLRIVDRLERPIRDGRVRTEAQVRDVVAAEIAAILGDPPAEPPLGSPHVIVVVGVNGVGKTTTIGKLAHAHRRAGRRVVLAAADTFRAGAMEQLRVWSERACVDLVGALPGADPAAVAYDAVDFAVSRGADVVIVDTAGRLHTQGDLMTELQKIVRVVGRRREGAPDEILMVLDATVGQNALSQVRTFGAAVPLTGLVLAKLDGSARGGAVVALRQECDVPVRWVGVGEAIDDLERFDPGAFARQVLAAEG